MIKKAEIEALCLLDDEEMERLRRDNASDSLLFDEESAKEIDADKTPGRIREEPQIV